jgi:hypothetical protein
MSRRLMLVMFLNGQPAKAGQTKAALRVNPGREDVKKLIWPIY